MTVQPESTNKAAPNIMVVAFTLASLAFFCIRLTPYLTRPTGGFLAYYTSGRLFAEHHNLSGLYDSTSFHNLTQVYSNFASSDAFIANSPVIPLLFYPLSHFPYAQAKFIWEILNFIAVIYALYLLQLHFVIPKIHFLALVGLTFIFTPLYVNFVWGQIYVILLLLHLSLLESWRARHDFLSSISIAFLLALKGYGIVFLLLALFQKKWRIIIYSIISYSSIVLITSLVIGLTPWMIHWQLLIKTIGATPYAATFQQNIHSMVSWLFVRDRWNMHPIFDAPWLVKPLVMLLGLAMLAFLYRVTIQPSSSQSKMIPVYMGTAISVLFAPLVGDYHYVLLLIPVFACYHQLLTLSYRKDLIMLGIALLLLSAKIPYNYPIFQNTWLGVFGFPRIYGTVLILVLLAQFSRRIPQTPAELITTPLTNQ